MATQSETWLAIAEELDIKVVAPFNYNFPGGTVEFAAMLPEFGGASGLIADPDWKKIEPVMSDLQRDGFGYSCLEVDGDANGVIEVLKDWPWTGASQRPDWLASG